MESAYAVSFYLRTSTIRTRTTTKFITQGTRRCPRLARLKLTTPWATRRGKTGAAHGPLQGDWCEMVSALDIDGFRVDHS